MTNIIDLFGNQHTIVPCTINDIDTHFEIISDVISSGEVIKFKQRMVDCVNAGSAYTLSNTNCFLYYYSHQEYCATGVAMYGKNNPLQLLTLFVGIFTLIDKKIFKLNFHLHSNKFVNEYKSLLTITSIKRNHIPGSPLVVRIDKLIKKIGFLYNKREIQWVV